MLNAISEKLNNQAAVDRYPLHIASRMGHVQSCKVLLEAGTDPNLSDHYGMTPLDLANSKEIATLLLEAGAAVNGIDGKPSRSGYPTPLGSAILKENTQVVEVLLKAGADPNCSVNGVSMLHKAAQMDNPEIVQTLLEAGADPNSSYHYGITPIYVARSKETATLLIEAGANTSSYSEYHSPLGEAITQGNHQVVEVLLKAGADTNRIDADPDDRSENQTSMLHKAAQGDNPKMVHALLDAGANPNSSDYYERSPLHLARSEEIATLLLEAGADANAQDHTGETPQEASFDEGVKRVISTYAKKEALTKLAQNSRPHDDDLASPEEAMAHRARSRGMVM